MPKTDSSFYIVTGIFFLLQNDSVSLMRDIFEILFDRLLANKSSTTALILEWHQQGYYSVLTCLSLRLKPFLIILCLVVNTVLPTKFGLHQITTNLLSYKPWGFNPFRSSYLLCLPTGSAFLDIWKPIRGESFASLHSVDIRTGTQKSIHMNIIITDDK